MVMFDLVRVVDVRYLRGHVLWLRFNDGVEGSVDLGGSLRGPMFDALRDPVQFARVRLDGPTIAWPNGADWAPEWLHDRVLATLGAAAKPRDGADNMDRAHDLRVPEISRFLGIVIRMYFVDHARPHFHAEYGEHSIAIEIDGDGVRGRFPPHRLPLLFEWRDLHREELLANWNRLRAGEPARPIAPLE